MAMGVTIKNRHYESLAEVPDSAIYGRHGLSLDLQAIDAQIEHWAKKLENPRATIMEHATAMGQVGAFQAVRAIHGLPLLEVG